MEIILSIPIILLNLVSPLIYGELLSGYIRSFGPALLFLIMIGFLSAIIGLLVAGTLGFIVAGSAAINLVSPLAILLFQAHKRASAMSPQDRKHFRDPFSL